jgi:hypothetical protein
LYFRSNLDQASLQFLAGLGLTVFSYGIAAARRLYRTMESSASCVYLLCFGVFSLGVCVFFLFNAVMPTFGLSIADTSWLTSPLLPEALVLTTIGALALILGSCVGAAWGAVRHQTVAPARALQDRQARAASAVFGMFLMMGSVGAFFVVGFRSDGLHAFTGGYGNWEQATASSSLPYVYAILGLALCMLAVGARSRSRRLGFAVFLVYALIALLVGLRSEVLFPAVAVLVMLGYRRRVLNGRRLIIIVIIALCAISGIRSFRGAGIAGAGPVGVPISLSPQDGLAELGFGLRPMVVVLQWQQGGQAALDGGSYTDPVTRIAHHLLPFLSPDRPAYADPDIISSTLLDTVGPIGFSPTAEGYDNFGELGVVGFMLVVGLALSWIDRSPRNAASELYRAAVLIPLLIEVRNTFTPVPVEILLGLGIVYVVMLIGRSFPEAGGGAAHTSLGRKAASLPPR